MTEFQKAVAKYKSDLNACYGSLAQRRVGRPISTGIGRRVTVYLPVKTVEILDQIRKNWAGSTSDIIQEAIARYAADLDAVINEGENHASAKSD